MNYHFGKEALKDFDKNIRKEWAVTNGIGGYAGSSIIGAHNRTHQGYLIASFHPPVSRYMVFSKTNESFSQGVNTYNLTTAMHSDHRLAEGQKYLQGFDYDGTVCFSYSAGQLSFKKYISLKPNANVSAVAYEFDNSGEEVEFTITPLMNFREHSESSTPDTLNFKVNAYDKYFTLSPEKEPKITINLGFSRGSLVERDEKYDINMQLQTEVDNEVEGLDCHFTPYDIVFTIPAKSKMRCSIICEAGYISDISDDFGNSASNVSYDNAFNRKCHTNSEPNLTRDNNGFLINDVNDDSAFKIREMQLGTIDKLIKKAGYTDEFANQLTMAANQFLAYRQSTGYKTILAGLPWFTDWGRDTMIAYTGLTLCTCRFDDAKDILLTFAQYAKNGIIPNMFPDNGQAPLYNTADASLWYFYAVYKYLTYVNTEDAYSFVQEKIYPVLVDIISAYKNGTDFSIFMDEDGLIHAGSGLDQVTWMDVRVGDWVATPRHGCPVEINALWYNALKVMELLAGRFGDDSRYYGDMADHTKKSFNTKFWNDEAGCLYDVVADEPDPTIRPNQIYAVSLTFTMLSPEKEASIVKVVQDKLYVGCGLRSLDPDHKDYHPIYLGSLSKRDAAYHQGTAWGFLLGGFITAYVKVHGANQPAAKEALDLLAPVKKHLWENCIGSICEIFDGDAPHLGRGCYAQAWSVGEVLRCYAEDVLPYL